MNYTPGPWIAPIRETCGDLSVEARSLVHNNPIFIARVYGPGGFSKDVETRNANARLIAAAPSLVTALLDLMDIVEEMPAIDEPGEYAIHSALTAARKALELAGVKTEGGAS